MNASLVVATFSSIFFSNLSFKSNTIANLLTMFDHYVKYGIKMQFQVVFLQCIVIVTSLLISFSALQVFGNLSAMVVRCSIFCACSQLSAFHILSLKCESFLLSPTLKKKKKERERKNKKMEESKANDENIKDDESEQNPE